MEMFLTVILIIIASFWLLGKVFKYLLPYLLLRYQRRFSERMGGESFSGFSGFAGAKTKKEGDVTVEKQKQTQTHNIDKSLGDYVEFEEEK